MVSTPLGCLLCLLLTLVAFATSSSAVSSVRSSLVSSSINRKISIRLVERINKKDDIDPFQPTSPHASLTYPAISESPSTVPTTAPSMFPNNIPTNTPSFFPIKGPSFSLSPQMQKGGDGINLANEPYDSAAPTSSPLDFIYDAVPNDKASSIQHTLSLQMFLPNFTTLDGQDIGIFERSIRNFVVGHAHDISMPPEVSIQIMTAVVVGQVLKWAQKNRVRSQNDVAPLGLNVYYEMDVVTTGEILKTQLEDSIQAMFDQNPGLFEEELRYAFARRYGKTTESNSSTESEPVSIDAMAATTIGCGVFIAFVLGGLFVYKINKKETDEDPPLNSPSGYLFAKKQMIGGYPTQQPRSQSDHVLDLEINSIESNDDMDQIHDDSFSVSVAYCPSVFQSEMRVFNIRDPEEESDRQEMKHNVYSESKPSKSTKNLGAFCSTKRPRSPNLTADDLSAFDADMRRGSF